MAVVYVPNYNEIRDFISLGDYGFFGTHKSIAALVSDATKDLSCILQIYNDNSNIDINSYINFNINIIRLQYLGHAYTKEINRT